MSDWCFSLTHFIRIDSISHRKKCDNFHPILFFFEYSNAMENFRKKYGNYHIRTAYSIISGWPYRATNLLNQSECISLIVFPCFCSSPSLFSEMFHFDKAPIYSNFPLKSYILALFEHIILHDTSGNIGKKSMELLTLDLLLHLNSESIWSGCTLHNTRHFYIVFSLLHIRVVVVSFALYVNVLFSISVTHFISYENSSMHPLDI